MTPRVLALLMLVAMLGFAGFMGSVGFMVREPLQILAPHQSLTLQSGTLSPAVSVQVAVDGRFQVRLEVDHPGRTRPPEVLLAPAGAAPIDIDWQAAGDARLSGRGQMSRPGRWEVTLYDGSMRESLPFVVRE